MITYDIYVPIGIEQADKAATVKCHDTGANLRIFLEIPEKISKYRSRMKLYTIPDGATAILKVKKPDNTYTLTDGKIEGSSIYFEPVPQTFTAMGVAEAEVSLYGQNDRRLTSASFLLVVTREAADDCAEDSSSYVDILAEQIAAVNAAAEEAAKKAVSDKLDTNQGAENAGKVLVIDDDGYAVPGEVQGSGETGAGIYLTGATAGQIPQIAEVDENGVPTAWHPADLPKVEIPPLIVNMTPKNGQWVADRTRSEIVAHVEKGGSVGLAAINNLNAYYWSHNDQHAIFRDVRTATARAYTIYYYIDESGVCTDKTQDYTPPAMTGATADTDGASGLVPAPAAGDEGKFLRGDGTWGDIDIPEGGGGGIVYNAKTPPEGLTAAVGDGETDDAPALNALVTHINSIGGGIIYLPKGVYMLDEPIAWMSNVSLVGENMGLSILKPRQAVGVGYGFSAIHNVSYTASNPMVNCEFRNFCVDGEEMNITSYSFRPKGIHIIFMKDCIFQNLIIRNTCASGLGIDHLSNVVIDNVGCYNCGRSWNGNGTEANVGGAGLGIGTKRMNGEAVIIRNCICDGCGNYGIFLEDQGSASTDGESYIISNNIVKNGRNHGIVVKGGSRVIVANNTSFRNAKDGFAVLENNGFLSDIIKFSNNLSYENGNGFRLESNGACEDIFVSENVFSWNKNGVVINTATSDLEIMRNTIKNNNVGVSMASVQHTDFVFKDNIIFKNLSDYDIDATFAGDVTYNDIAETDVTAIRFPHSTYNVTEGKTITLRVDFEPAYATGDVVYESDSNDIVTISGNVLSAVAPGSVTVTAKCGTLTATCTVTVIEASEDEPAEGKNLWDSSIELTAGYIDKDGVLKTEDSVDNLVCDSYIQTENGGAYRFNVGGVNIGTATWRIAEYDENYVFIQRSINLTLGQIIKLSENTAYVKIGVSCKVSNAAIILENGYFARYNIAIETLPAEYTKVDSVTASGTQYIDTGFVPNQDTKVSIMAKSDKGSSNTMAWFGARIGNGNDAFDVRDNGYANYGDEAYDKYTIRNDIVIRTLDKNKYYEEGNLKHTFTYTTFSAGCNLLLCALNSGGSAVETTFSKMRVFGCEIYDNDMLVRKFVPAKRIADNVYGLYDTCNGVFYESAGSSGFTA